MFGSGDILQLRRLPAARAELAGEQRSQLPAHMRLRPGFEGGTTEHHLVIFNDVLPDLGPRHDLAVSRVAGDDGERPWRQHDLAFPFRETGLPEHHRSCRAATNLSVSMALETRASGRFFGVLLITISPPRLRINLLKQYLEGITVRR